MQIKTFDDYKAILAEARKFGKPVINNNLLMKKRVVELIKAKSLYCKKGKGYICFYIKEKGQYRLLITAANADEILIDKKELPLRFEYTFNVNHLLERKVAEIMNRNGFELISKNIEMRLDKNNPNIQSKAPIKDIEIRQIRPDEVDAILKIWTATLLYEINPVPGRLEVLENFEDIFLILKNDFIVGGSRLIQRGNRAYIEQLAIDPNFQRRGYGLALLTYFQENFSDKDIYLWVSLNNRNAVTMYEKFGFEISGKQSLQYFMEETINEK